MSEKIAVVTGASRGIGLAISRKLLKLGYYTIGTSTTGTAPDHSGMSECWAVDFNDTVSMEQFMLKLKGLTRIDILVNNAGINIIKKQAEISSEEFSAIENINLRAPFFISSAAAEIMARSGGGRIVNIGSIWSVISKEHRTLYSTMKSGLLGLSRSMAVEWAKKNVLINTVSPGFVNTDLTKQSLTEEELIDMSKKIPVNRLAEPGEIAELVAFLAGESNTYLTGQNIVIDGGFSIV